MTKQIRNDKMSELNTTEKEKNKNFSKKLKKFLTKSKQHDRISKLSETAKNIDN